MVANSGKYKIDSMINTPEFEVENGKYIIMVSTFESN